MATTSLNAQTASLPSGWDGLVRVDRSSVDELFLDPSADFSGFTKVMLAEPEVSFRPNWQRDRNRQVSGVSGRVADRDVRRIIDEASEGADSIFAQAFADAGFEVVTEAGPDVLLVSIAIVNLDIVAPDVGGTTRSRSYVREAGAASLIIEARDSVSGGLMGRAIDSRTTGDNIMLQANRVTNRAEFSRLFRRWARTSAEGLAQLTSEAAAQSSGD
jgi:hypothetical protein